MPVCMCPCVSEGGGGGGCTGPCLKRYCTSLPLGPRVRPAPFAAVPSFQQMLSDDARAVLQEPLDSLEDVDALINKLTPSTLTDRKCCFFANNAIDVSEEFWTHGLPFMIQSALAANELFPSAVIPTSLSRQQCASLLALSTLGIFNGATEGKHKYRFRVHQLLTLQCTPSVLCLLQYFTTLGKDGVPGGTVVFERRRAAVIFADVENSCAPLCEIEFISEGPIEDDDADGEAVLHVDFANMQIGGGVLTGDFGQEEIMFLQKPEMMVGMAFSPLLKDDEVIVIHGAMRYSRTRGQRSAFAFDGPAPIGSTSRVPSVVCLDALDLRVGLKPRMFEAPFLRRDLLKAYNGFVGAAVVVSGHWGCGAFGHEPCLKLAQQWIAASAAGVKKLRFHPLKYSKGDIAAQFARLVGEKGVTSSKALWDIILKAAAAMPTPCFKPDDFQCKIFSLIS